jgi:hypothetical protein
VEHVHMTHHFLNLSLSHLVWCDCVSGGLVSEEVTERGASCCPRLHTAPA